MYQIKWLKLVDVHVSDGILQMRDGSVSVQDCRRDQVIIPSDRGIRKTGETGSYNLAVGRGSKNWNGIGHGICLFFLNPAIYFYRLSYKCMYVPVMDPC